MSHPIGPGRKTVVEKPKAPEPKPVIIPSGQQKNARTDKGEKRVKVKPEHTGVSPRGFTQQTIHQDRGIRKHGLIPVRGS